jgi:UrcA family protein
MKRFNVILTLTLGLCAAQAALATAPVGDSVRTRTIPLSGLDLSRSADAAKLYSNIKRAAVYVCQPLNGDDLARTMHYRKCVSGTVARAVADVHAPLLNQYVVFADTRSFSQE